MNQSPETPTPPEWLEEVLDAISCTDGVNDHRWSTDEKGKITVELDYGNEALSFEADTDGEMHGANFDNVIYDMTDSESVQFWCAGELYTRLQKAKEPKDSWISVEDDTPAIQFSVCIAGILEGEDEPSTHEGYFTGRWWQSIRWDTDKDRLLRINSVTHWREMPPLPNKPA